jgi:heptosyltransferase-2
MLLTKAAKAPKHLGKYEPVSAVDYYLQLLDTIGVGVQSRQPELYTTANGELTADDIWKAFGWESYNTVVALNTGGAYGAAKHWPNQHSAQLALRLANDGHRVLIMCGPKETDAAREIEDLARHPLVKSMADQDLSLEASKACLRRTNLLVSTDSGPRHIASAFDVPTVTLFGPIDPAWSYNYATTSIEMHDRLDCSPCGKRVCPLGHHRCMNDLTPERVHAAVNSLLGQSEADQAA